MLKHIEDASETELVSLEALCFGDAIEQDGVAIKKQGDIKHDDVRYLVVVGGYVVGCVALIDGRWLNFSASLTEEKCGARGAARATTRRQAVEELLVRCGQADALR